MRVVSNLVSRCNRVEIALKVDLDSSVGSEVSFVELMVRIHRYAVSVSQSVDAARSLTGTLRHAVRKYAEFAVSKKAKDYRYSHGLTTYR